MLEWLDIAQWKQAMLHGVELLQFILELVSVACVAVGVIQTARLVLRERDTSPGFSRIRLCFGSWLILALEFQLAADILATTIAPSQEELIRLAVIAIIRTFLNYFLAKELEGQREQPLPGS